MTILEIRDLVQIYKDDTPAYLLIFFFIRLSNYPSPIKHELIDRNLCSKKIILSKWALQYISIHNIWFFVLCSFLFSLFCFWWRPVQMEGTICHTNTAFDEYEFECDKDCLDWAIRNDLSRSCVWLKFTALRARVVHFFLKVFDGQVVKTTASQGYEI